MEGGEEKQTAAPAALSHQETESGSREERELFSVDTHTRTCRVLCLFSCRFNSNRMIM